VKAAGAAKAGKKTRAKQGESPSVESAEDSTVH
jgi:hypothetical protein